MNDSLYCGKCKQKYSTRQNWANHFSKQKVKARLKLPGVNNLIPNICYNTSDPKVCDAVLEKAIATYEQQLKQKCYFKSKLVKASHEPPLRENTEIIKKRKGSQGDVSSQASISTAPPVPVQLLPIQPQPSQTPSQPEQLNAGGDIDIDTLSQLFQQ